jgi:glycine cleavage system H lipoate-binding protein
MTCPFLKEAQVKYCQASPVRKLIPLAAAGRADEKCSSREYLACPVFRAQSMEPAAANHCPYLAESLMQYCSAAPVAKMIPYSESQLSRCGCDRFRYCELYLSMAHPAATAADDVDGIPLPAWLRYTANHMWLDIGEDGVCHVGIDAFLSRALGQAERISYVWQRGRHRGTAVVTVAGVDHEVVFPNPFLITNCNLYLRADPSRLISEPYTGGWLFEGEPAPETTANLLEGAAARQWMEQEQHRINEFLQQQPGSDGPLAADGGLFAPCLSRYLDRDRMLALFHTFFSPYASRSSQAERVQP